MAHEEPNVDELLVEYLIYSNRILIFLASSCPVSKKLQTYLDANRVEYYSIDLDEHVDRDAILAYLDELTGQTFLPSVFLDGEHLGGYEEAVQAHEQGRLVQHQVDDTISIRKPNERDDEEIESEDQFGARLPMQYGLRENEKPEVEMDQIGFMVQGLIEKKKILIFSKSNCAYSQKTKDLFKSLNQHYIAIDLDKTNEGEAMKDFLFEKTGVRTLPSVFINGVHLGSYQDCMSAQRDGRLAIMLSEETKTSGKSSKKARDPKYDYDLVVIGGGSGGLACSKEAAELGAKVAVLDYVKPTPKGTTWGLGGTCVNVGCIPKKLMHQAALIGESMLDSPKFGWKLSGKVNHSWETMRDNIQKHIESLNSSYRCQLKDKKVEYLNAFGQFINRNKLKVTYKGGKTQEISAKYIVIAVGVDPGRPKYPDETKGAKENCITSDDLFSLKYNPGKTLCIGASYVSLECAGFLKGLGLDVTVMVRSILLRGFDQQMAKLIGDHMQKHGIKFIKDATPTEVKKIKDGKPGEYLVKYKTDKGKVQQQKFNTVLLAIGRDPCTKELLLNKCGVKLNPKTQKIPTSFEQTNVANIYAIGDVIEEKSANGRILELTPVAIKAGQLLAKRLFSKSAIKMDYGVIATTVFTPLEYGSIGLAEEEAIQKFGAKNIEVYHTHFWPLEWTIAKKPNNVCYAKLICNKSDKERVVGFHVAGPNAGEITQGFATALKLKATKKDFDMTIGIHPTCAEVMTTLNVTKKSGKEVVGGGC